MNKLWCNYSYNTQTVTSSYLQYVNLSYYDIVNSIIKSGPIHMMTIYF